MLFVMRCHQANCAVPSCLQLCECSGDMPFNMLQPSSQWPSGEQALQTPVLFFAPVNAVDRNKLVASLRS